MTCRGFVSTEAGAPVEQKNICVLTRENGSYTMHPTRVPMSIALADHEALPAKLQEEPEATEASTAKKTKTKTKTQTAQDILAAYDKDLQLTMTEASGLAVRSASQANGEEVMLTFAETPALDGNADGITLITTVQDKAYYVARDGDDVFLFDRNKFKTAIQKLKSPDQQHELQMACTWLNAYSHYLGSEEDEDEP
eukprot:SAG31_NODE_15495_length_752_cov_1.079632_1_plen_195_part_01